MSSMKKHKIAQARTQEAWEALRKANGALSAERHEAIQARDKAQRQEAEMRERLSIALNRLDGLEDVEKKIERMTLEIARQAQEIAEREAAIVQAEKKAAEAEKKAAEAEERLQEARRIIAEKDARLARIEEIVRPSLRKTAAI